MAQRGEATHAQGPQLHENEGKKQTFSFLLIKIWVSSNYEKTLCGTALVVPVTDINEDLLSPFVKKYSLTKQVS